MSKFGNITIPATGSIAFPASGVAASVVSATIEAHPSNAGVIYVKLATETNLGYPLAAGATLNLGRNNLSDYVASGAPNARLAYVYEQ